MITQPSKESIRLHLDKVRSTIKYCGGESAEYLIKKLNPTGLMAISGGVHKDGTSVIALHYDEDNDGVEDSMMLYNYGNLPDKTTIVHPKECFDDLNKNGIYKRSIVFRAYQ